MRYTMSHQNTKPIAAVPPCDAEGCRDSATRQHTFIARAHTRFGVTQDGERAYMTTCSKHADQAQRLADAYAAEWLSQPKWLN